MLINERTDNFIKYLKSLEKSNTQLEKDKLTKISNWLGVYQKYLEYETNFNPEKLLKYNRGDIIKVDFGFNVGNELGGVHFAIVLDNENSCKSGTVSVIPLSSKKNKKINFRYSIDLGDSLVKSLNEKKANLKKEITKISEVLDEERTKLMINIDELENNSELLNLEKIKLEIIKNPKKYAYYISDKKYFIIKNKDKDGLGSLPNNIYDEIYRENNKYYHSQAIGKIILNKIDNWVLDKQNETMIIFKVEKIGAFTNLNEITTICSHFISRSFEEVIGFKSGVCQGGRNGDLILCVEKKFLEELSVDGLKKYLNQISIQNKIELYYQLEKALISELPALNEYELKNLTVIKNKSKMIEDNQSKLSDKICELENKILTSKIKIEGLRQRHDSVEKVQDELNRIKIDSIALVSQITTISKLRIITPKKRGHSLYSIKIDDSNMKKITEKISDLFS